MLQLLGAIGPIAKLIAKTVDKAVPDKDLKEKLKHDINTQLLNAGSQEMQAASKIILAEASSGSWLTNSWRPALMWICIIVIANNFIISPILELTLGTSLNLEIPEPMWNLLTIGVGGYICGRSAEKVATNWKK